MTSSPVSYAWRDSYRLGIPVVDAEHRRFFDLLNGLHEVVQTGGSPEAVGSQLAALDGYALIHFRNEEEFLGAVGCPDLPLQESEHAVYHRHLRRMVEEGGRDPVEAIRFARDWLLEHVLGTDRRYSAWISFADPVVALSAMRDYGRPRLVVR